jgi:hypothetical protein
MDIMTMARAAVSPLGTAVREVRGPVFGNPDDPSFGQAAVIWLTNGYGVSIAKGDNPLSHDPMDSDTAEILVLREINDVGSPTGKSSVHDYSTPVGSQVRSGSTIEDIVEALVVLSGLVNDPYDVQVWGLEDEDGT